MSTRLLRILFVAYVVATVVHIAWVVHHEPFAYDAWNLADDTKAEPFSFGHFLEYWKLEYTHSNPRFGQPFAYLGYKLEWFAVIATPLAYLATALAAFVLGTGRRPTKDRDLALYAMILGFMWFALPQIGKTLFVRAYAANYLYTAAIQLWFLVPLRLRPKANASTLAVVGYGLAGVIAGSCNEHTGPTLCALMLGYAWWRRETRPRLAWAGAFGSIAGFALIFFAPGQGHRYNDLAQKVTLWGRLMNRGVSGNLGLVYDWIVAMAPVLVVMVVIAAVGLVREAGYAEQRERRRWAERAIVMALAGGLLVTMTLFVSPKLGPRFFIVPMMLLVAACVAMADAVLVEERDFAPFVAVAVIASIYAIGHTVPLYGRLAKQSDARLAQLEKAPRGSVVTLESWEQIEDSWWFFGDDAKAPNKRELIAKYFDLAAVVYRAYDPTMPLGVSDVRLVPSERGLELDQFRGIDLDSIHKAIQTMIATNRPHSDRVDVTVEFVGVRPPLPAPTILVGRWANGFEGPTAKITRKGTTRTIEVKDAAPDAEIYVALVGGEAKRLGKVGEPLKYTPWQTGTYWVLACRAAECFVLAAARQGG